MTAYVYYIPKWDELAIFWAPDMTEYTFDDLSGHFVCSVNVVLIGRL